MDELTGADAVEFATKLRLVSTDPHSWLEHYVDDSTGQRWVLDDPSGALHGGGAPRLRRT